MKDFVFDKISFDYPIHCSALPFELRGEARACPVRVRIGFEITQMRYRFGFIDGAKTRKGEVPPGAVAFAPVKRCFPMLFVHRHPTESQPELRTLISIVFDERDVIAV